MLSFNLLNPSDKKQVNYLKLYLLLKNIIFKLFSYLLIFSLVFIFIYILAVNNKNSINDQLQGEIATQQKEKLNSIDEATSRLNIQLALAQNIQKKFIQWTSFIAKLNNLIPTGITLTNMELLTTTRVINLNGMSKDREALLNFQKNLKESKYLSDINTPISNLIQKENIEFQITGKLTEALYE